MPRVIALIATAIVLMAGAVRFAAAGIQFGTTSCCCGPHASNHACGCPDCPSGVRAGDADHHDDDHPAMGRCGANGQVVLAAAPAPALAAGPRPAQVGTQPVALVHTPAPPPLRNRPRGPEPPPPR